MDKEVVVHIHNGILAIKRTKIASFDEMCKDLVAVTESEVRKRQTNTIY